MAKIRTCELSGAALDWAVAKAEGWIEDFNSWLHEATVDDVADSTTYRPSEHWATGGPIIEREHVVVFPAIEVTPIFWCAVVDRGGSQSQSLHDLDGQAWYFMESEVVRGDTPLIAAMRAFVMHRLGREVTLPDPPPGT